MAKIQLSRGLRATVDDDLSEYLNQWKWSAAKVGYAYRMARNGRKRVAIYMHRLILEAPEGVYVDHIDGDKLNNQVANLRLCTNSQNLSNRKTPPKNNRSGYKGVCWSDRDKKYRANIVHQGRQIALGYYDTAEQAAHAWNKKAVELRGDFAVINQIKER